jgi:hypothetical protein
MMPFLLRRNVLESPMKTHATEPLAPSALIAASDPLLPEFEGRFFI